MTATPNTLRLRRTHHSPNQTEGVLEVLSPSGAVLFSCVTLELPWRENRRRISCIPTGTYQIVPRTSVAYGRHLHILNVPGRDMILIHQANFVAQLMGCIAVGRTRTDLNADGLRDVTHSVATKNHLLTFVPTPTTITIL